MVLYGGGEELSACVAVYNLQIPVYYQRSTTVSPILG